jgi:hypothetical protein
MMVLAVIAVATIAIVRLMHNNSNTANGQQMIADVTAISTQIKNNYSSSSTGYDGLDTAQAISQGDIPSDLPTNGGAIQNQFSGGNVTIGTANNNASYTISYTSVPPSVCEQVINSLVGNFQEIQVGDTVVYENDSGGNTPLNITTLTSACNPSGSNSVAITFTGS